MQQKNPPKQEKMKFLFILHTLLPLAAHLDIRSIITNEKLNIGVELQLFEEPSSCSSNIRRNEILSERGLLLPLMFHF